MILQRQTMSKKKDLIVAIKDEDDWNRFMVESDKLCLVIDVHQDWCGPCDCLEPTFKKMWMDVEDCDNRLKFLTANLKTLSPKVKSVLTQDSNIKVDSHGCLPFFLIVRYRQVVGTVVGVNTPAIQQLVNLNLPEKPKDGDN